MKKKDNEIDEGKTGRQIALLMEREGLSIKELARYLEVSDNAVRNYVKGINLPKTERMYKICKKLNVDIKDIIIENQEKK